MSLVEEGLAAIVGSRAAPVEQLRAVVRHQVQTVVAEQAFLTVFFAEEASLPLRLRRAIVRRKARYDHAVQKIVARCGRLTTHPRLVVFALLGMSNWTHRWYDARGRWDADYIADGFIALMERGYLANPEASRRDVARRLGELQREIRALRQALGASSLTTAHGASRKRASTSGRRRRSVEGGTRGARRRSWMTSTQATLAKARER